MLLMLGGNRMSIHENGSAIKLFGERLRDFRKRRHWTQEKLATKAGLNQSEISKIEKGQAKEPRVDTIRKLAKALEFEPEDLVRTTPFAALFGQAEILADWTVTEGPPIVAYFASALTILNDDEFLEIKSLDERVDEICRAYTRYPLFLYRPRTETSPTDQPDIPAREVYEIDQERVATSDLLILAAVFPSLGAGMELQLALQSCSSVILLKKKGQKLSRMVTGCPARMEIVEYESLDDLQEGLPTALDELVPRISQFRFGNSSDPSPAEKSSIGDRIRHVREHQRKMTVEDLARMVGVGDAYIESLETRPEEVTNPSLQILRRIARALNVAESFLMTGREVPIQNYNSIFARHKLALDAYASEVRMPVDQYKILWEQHVAKHGNEFSVLRGDQRLDIGDRKYWIDKHEKLPKETSQGLF